MSITERVVSDPEIMMGEPVIPGTRITVELFLEKLAAGESFEEILGAHPRLTRERVLAALAFAAEAMKAEVAYPPNKTAPTPQCSPEVSFKSPRPDKPHNHLARSAS
jgi:uncharacterized protein (DUF433 family)